MLNNNTYRSKFGLIEFFDQILDQELSIFALKYWSSWLKESKEDFESELYIICLEEVEALEKMTIKSVSNLKPELKLKGFDDADVQAVIAKSFRTQVKTFLRLQLIGRQEKENRLKFMDLKNPNKMIKDSVFFDLVEARKGLGVPPELLDFYNLRFLKRGQAIKKICEKHNISREVFNWRRQNWCYMQLNYMEKELQLFTDIETIDFAIETNNDNVTVMTMGTFDLFHEGHENLLNNLSIYGDNLIIGVNSDKFTESYKRKPLLNELERVAKVENYLKERLHVKFTVFINEGFEKQPEHILYYNPDIFCIGEDWSDPEVYGKQLYLGDDAEKWFDSNDIVLKYLPRTDGISTTELLQQQGEN